MVLERFKITGKVAIVTGGTRGIGLAIAHALGEAGAKLVVTSRTDKFGGLDSLKKAGHDVSFVESDITDRNVPQKIIDYTLDKHGVIKFKHAGPIDKKIKNEILNFLNNSI